MIDLRYATGPALIIVGAVLLTVAVRLWMVHPINRVFRIGPFVTERGMRAVLGLRTIFLAYGLLLVESGTFRCAYWYLYQDVDAPVVAFLGSLETGLAFWAAALSVRAAYRLWHVQ